MLTFDVANRKRSRELALTQHPALRRLTQKLDASFRMKRFLHNRGWISTAPCRPLFVRGLSRYRESLFVGMSPATILEIDYASGELVDRFCYRHEVCCCIHGLHVAESA